jgi:hypothetical protein
MRSAYIHGVDTFVEDVIVSYFFGSHVTKLQSSAEGLYRSILCQLLEKQPELSASLQKLGLHLDREHSVWHNELLKTLSRKAVLALDTKLLTCYVDALDECGHSDAQDVVDFFGALRGMAHKAGIEVRVMLSSRHYPQVALSDCQKIILEDEFEHQTDLSCYIESELRIGESSQARVIHNIIKQRASGVFLWVALVIQLLNQDKLRGRVHLLEKRLDALPDDLHELFGNILHSKPCDGSSILLTFQWLLFANRPLRREELYFALMTSDSEGEISAWDRDKVSTTDMENFILDSSRGLVEITKGTQPIVQFIHGSVRDYLLKTGLSSLHPPTTTDLFALCQDRLKQCCLQYILRSTKVVLHSSTCGVRSTMFQCFRKTKELRARTDRSHPFLDYALSGMVFHSNEAQLLGLQQDTFIGTFPLDAWVRLNNVLANIPTDRLGAGASREYIFVIKNAPGLIGILVEESASRIFGSWDAREERYHSCLGAAVANGYAEMAELLLKHGFRPDSRVRNSLSCLQVAVMQGNAGMVRMLLDYHVNVQRTERHSRATHPCPLRIAAELGHAAFVDMLLSHPDYADDWHPDIGHVLEAAIYRRDSAILQLLHDRMNNERKDVIRMLHGATDHGAVDANCVPGALHSFRVYYQTRDRNGPALLDTIHAAYLSWSCAHRRMHGAPSPIPYLHRDIVDKAYWQLHKTSNIFPLVFWDRAIPKRDMVCLHPSTHPCITAGVSTVVQVFTLLDQFTSALPAPILMRLGLPPIWLENLDSISNDQGKKDILMRLGLPTIWLWTVYPMTKGRRISQWMVNVYIDEHGPIAGTLP